jgi:acetyl esterase/lipase
MRKRSANKTKGPGNMWRALCHILWCALPLLETAHGMSRQPEAVPEDVEATRNVEYCQGGGHPLHMDIYRPKSNGKTRPAVLWIHGGGWRSGGKDDNHMAVVMAKSGFIAVTLEYRLSPESKFPSAVEDCECAVRYLRANAAKYSIDPRHIAVGGESSGGHLAMLAAMAGAQAKLEGQGGWNGISSRVQAVISYFGPADLTAPHPTAVDTILESFLGTTFSKDPQLFKNASPVSWVASGSPPLLLIHGDDDMLVPLSQSQEMLELYHKVKSSAELIVVKGAGHDFSQASSMPISPSINEIESATIRFLSQNLCHYNSCGI